MSLKYYFSIFLLVIAAQAAIPCGAQKKNFGYIVTNTNDTVRGYFKLAISTTYPTDSTHTIALVVNTAKNAKTNMNITDIKNIDIVKGKRIVASYIIYGNDFWRLLAIQDTLGIYALNYKKADKYVDYSDFTNNDVTIASVTEEYPTVKYLKIAIFYGNKQSLQMYDDLQNVNDTYIGKQVLKFINWRYDVKLSFKDLNIDQRVDFVHQQKLFDFILDKEAELEKDTTAAK